VLVEDFLNGLATMALRLHIPYANFQKHGARFAFYLGEG
jgi:hypothetical protein